LFQPLLYQVVTASRAVLDWPVKVHDPAYREILAPILEKAVESAGGDFVAAVKSVLNSNFGVECLTRSDLSRALGVSVHVLSRRLTSAGVTHDLAEQMRIERAQSLLLRNKRIGEVSSDVGFAHVSSFDRAFRKCLGQSPARWKKARMAQQTD
jgi:AraC-like DNA-binding protein